MKSTVIALAAFAATIGTSASAQTFDAFRDFNGAPQPQANPLTNGRFIYGEANPTTPNSAGTFFQANTGCFVGGSICLQRTPGNVPGFTKSAVSTNQFGYDIPTDRLVGHPGSETGLDTLLTFVAFVAPTAGFYRFSATFSALDPGSNGVGVTTIGTTGGGLPLTFTNRQVITNGTTTTISGLIQLGASEAFGFGLDNNGNFENDSTGVDFFLRAGVPEPATWAMMIMGFGLVGFALRRKPRTSVTFATA